MSYPTIRRCQHLKINGTQCGSPALRDQKRCYFHTQLQQRSMDIVMCEDVSTLLPTLEDANSIQMALSYVMRLLVIQEIDHRTAALLLRALRTAAANVKYTSFEPQQPTQVVIDPACVENRPLGATAWSAVEGKEYDESPVNTSVSAAKQTKAEEKKTKEAHWRELIDDVANGKILERPDNYPGYEPESVDQVSV